MARYFVLTALGGVLAGFGLGLTSGWFLFQPSRQERYAPRVGADKAAAPKPSASASTSSQPAPGAGQSDPNLSFYKTLPSGKAILGTGLNPAKPEEPAATQALPHPSATPKAMDRRSQTPSKTASVPAAPNPPPRHDNSLPENPEIKPPSLTAVPAPAASPSGAEQSRKSQSKGKYVVQVASFQSKSEAEAVKAQLTEAGLPAYIVEWSLKDKGTMYRVRVGRRLELSEAVELATKSGKNSILVME